MSSALARVQELRKLAGREISPLGLSYPPTGPVIYRGDDRWEWVLLALEDDPLFQRKQLAIPKDVQRKLESLDDRGVKFDSFVIGHEVPKGYLPDKPAAADLKVALEQAAATQAVHAGPLERSVDMIMAVAVGAVTVAAAAMVAPVAMVGALAASDPVLIGGVTVDETGLTAYFEIARW